MARVQDLDPATLTAEQRQLYDAIAGPRHGTVRGPFAIWLRTPAIAEQANAFGNMLRLSGKLDKTLFELMVLLVARHWSAQYEWFAHDRNAREAGLDPEIIAAIRERRRPALSDERQRVVYDVVSELIETKTVSAATYERAVSALGLDLLIELITSAGFYTMVAMMLNAFDAPVPGGAKPLNGETPAPGTAAEARPVRRVVSGHDERHAARIFSDGSAKNVHRTTGATSTLMWCTDRTPAQIGVGTAFEDMGERKLGTPPPRNGTRFAVNDFPPGNTARMHRTETLDYVIVMDGEIDMDTDDDQSVHLRAGDVLIQRGTNHAWVNRSDRPARVAFILIDAEPLGFGEPLTGSV